MLLPDAACEVGLHRGCRRREESLFARQAVQDSAQGKGGGPCLTPPLQPHHWGQTLGVPKRRNIMLEKYWIKCPICNGKTRVQVFYNTVLRNFPLFCPKCKLTHIIDVEKLEIIIKNSEKQKEGY